MPSAPPPLPSFARAFQFHYNMALAVADLGNLSIDFLPSFFVAGCIGVIRSVELHRVSTLTSAALVAAPFVYLAVAAFFPSAREIFVSVHLLRAVVLTSISVLQMMLARQTVRRAASQGGGIYMAGLPALCVFRVTVHF